MTTPNGDKTKPAAKATQPPAQPPTEQTVEQPRNAPEPTDRTIYFGGSVVKVDAEGNESLSNFLEPGERLRHANDETAVRTTLWAGPENSSVRDTA